MLNGKLSTLLLSVLLPLILSNIKVTIAAPTPQTNDDDGLADAATRLANAQAAQQLNTFYQTLAIGDGCTGSYMAFPLGWRARI